MPESAPPQPLSRPSRVLLLGAGWLGRAIAESYANDGVAVTTVRRSPHEPVPGGTAVAYDLARLVGPGASRAVDPTSDVDAASTGDAADAASTGDAADAGDAVDAAGGHTEVEHARRPHPDLPDELLGHDVVIVAVAPDRGRGDDYASTYPVAAAAAAFIAQQSGAKAMGWVSSTGVYGVIDGREVTEETPRQAAAASNAALIAAEDLILAQAQPERRVAVFRASGLYGPGRDPAPRFRDVQALRGRSAHWVNLAWRDDVVSAIRYWTEHALTHLGSAVATPRVFNVSDGTPLTVAECARLVALADGRPFVPPSDDTHDTEPARSNQRIRIDALRELGWSPSVPNLRAGLERLGYARLAVHTQPYGPQSAEIRRFLRALAALSPDEHDKVCADWLALRQTAAFARADRALGEAMVRSNREAERDAAAGPLIEMFRVKPSPPDSSETPNALDPIAEPALATLMALVVRDVLAEELFSELVRPLAFVLSDNAR